MRVSGVFLVGYVHSTGVSITRERCLVDSVSGSFRS